MHLQTATAIIATATASAKLSKYPEEENQKSLKEKKRKNCVLQKKILQEEKMKNETEELLQLQQHP